MVASLRINKTDKIKIYPMNSEPQSLTPDAWLLIFDHPYSTTDNL